MLRQHLSALWEDDERTQDIDLTTDKLFSEKYPGKGVLLSPCTVCRYQVIDGTASVCPNCGASLVAGADSASFSEGNQNRSVPAAGAPGLPQTPSGKTADDALEICDPGEFLASESAAPEPEQEKSTASGAPPALQPAANAQSDSSPESEDSGAKKNLRRLSAEQITAIRSNLMNGNDDYVSPDRASSILNTLAKTNGRIDPTPTDSDPNQAESHQPAPAEVGPIPKAVENTESTPTPIPAVRPAPTAPGVRRIAYYHKSFIQITGTHTPQAGEELVIGERHYLLKPKKIDRKYAIAGFSIVLALFLFFLGQQLLSPTVPGAGTIIGIVLDQDGRPFGAGTEISIPESGKKVASDAIGFFRFDKVPTGVYKLKYKRPDGSYGTETISVVSDLITTITLGKHWSELAVPNTDVASVMNQNQPVTSPVPQSIPSSGGPSETKKPAGGRESAAVKLQANVDDARLTVDGKTVGAGNLTYKNLESGSVMITVSREGYKSWTGNVLLKGGETYALNVTLERFDSNQQTPSYSAEDFYQSGQAMLTQGNSQAAVGDFTEAIDLNPKMAEAFYGRARAHQLAETYGAAETDFVKAGELFSSQKRYETARDAFDKALELNKKSLPALLNVAALTAQQGNQTRAFELYNEVLKYENDNFEANLELGKLYFTAGKNKEAEKRLRKANELNPQAPESYHYLMLNYFARDDFGKVKTTYSSFLLNVPSEQVDKFKSDPKFDPIHRVIGEYERP